MIITSIKRHQDGFVSISTNPSLVPTSAMALPFKPSFPWLLYAYPWMPFPRRVIIYLREKGIPESLIKVARVTDPQNGNEVVDSSLPARPAGSLPILAIPSTTSEEGSNADQWVYIQQSMSIIHYLEELCNSGEYGFSSPHGSFVGRNALSRARIGEILSLAEECTIAW
jgi:glutathione S-transferase